MEKIIEIKNTLDFYVCANSLKNKLMDKKNNYSVADHLFGSMILATAIDSEFKETDDLSKTYRMLFLSEFSKLFPGYDYSILKLGVKYLDEKEDVKDRSNFYTKLVNKYKKLDKLLTKLIKENNFTEEELIKEGSNIIGNICKKDASECVEIFKFYYINFRLKDKVRSGWDNRHWNIKTNRKETVSEHIVGAFGLLMGLISEFEYDFDTDKLFKTIIIHETGETIIGDITPFDGITDEEKLEIEHQAMRKALGNLKDNKELLDLLFEFDEAKTKETNLLHKIDKAEADLQSKVYLERGLHHSLDDQENNVTFKSPKIQQMVKNGAKNAYDIWLEWDKPTYIRDNLYPEFINMLTIAQNSNILNSNNVLKEKVELTKEDHSYLTKIITCATKKFFKDDNVNVVYITNYQSNKNNKGILKITLLLKQGTFDYPYELLTKKMNEELAEKNNTGVRVLFDYDYENKYSTIAMNPSEVCRVEQLMESDILFDKKGKITKIQETMKKYGHLLEFYLVDYVPPIYEEIAKRLTKA